MEPEACDCPWPPSNGLAENEPLPPCKPPKGWAVEEVDKKTILPQRTTYRDLSPDSAILRGLLSPPQARQEQWESMLALVQMFMNPHERIYIFLSFSSLSMLLNLNIPLRFPYTSKHVEDLPDWRGGLITLRGCTGLPWGDCLLSRPVPVWPVVARGCC